MDTRANKATDTGEDGITWNCDEEVEENVVFMNHVDSYLSKHVSLVRHLANTIVGSIVSAEAALEGNRNGRTYKVVGTLKNPDDIPPSHVSRILDNTDLKRMARELCNYNTIVYDITEDRSQIQEMETVLELLCKSLKATKVKRRFILLSTVMTWANSQLGGASGEADDEDNFFTESDCPRRKAHDNFEDHLTAEKKVIHAGKQIGKFKTYVVCCGVVYGMGERVFHQWFKDAWHNTPILTLFGTGKNFVPTIYVLDVAMIVQNLIELHPEPTYILATDMVRMTQKIIVRTISRALGAGLVTNGPVPEAPNSVEGFTRDEMDKAMVNLQFEPVVARDILSIMWTNEEGFPPMSKKLVDEFKLWRKLEAVKICILGPPGVGKTGLAANLCEHFKLHHAKTNAIVASERARLTIMSQITFVNEDDDDRDASQEDAEDEDDRDPDLENEIEEAKQFLLDLETDLADNNGNLSEEMLTKLMKMKLLSHPCQNQGFVLDGYPTTLRNAEALFVASGGDEIESLEVAAIMPDYVFYLDADDNFLITRMRHLPEKTLAMTRFSEDRFAAYLKVYRMNNQPYSKVVKFFDEEGLNPCTFHVDSDELFLKITQLIKDFVGKPKNYGDPPEVIEARLKAAKEVELAKERKKEGEALAKLLAIEDARKIQQIKWAVKLDEVKAARKAHLASWDMPLRRYMKKSVFLPLSQGLAMADELIVKKHPAEVIHDTLFDQRPIEGVPDLDEAVRTKKKTKTEDHSVLDAVKAEMTRAALQTLQKAEQDRKDRISQEITERYEKGPTAWMSRTNLADALFEISPIAWMSEAELTAALSELGPEDSEAAAETSSLSSGTSDIAVTTVSRISVGSETEEESEASDISRTLGLSSEHLMTEMEMLSVGLSRTSLISEASEPSVRSWTVSGTSVSTVPSEQGTPEGSLSRSDSQVSVLTWMSQSSDEPDLSLVTLLAPMDGPKASEGTVVDEMPKLSMMVQPAVVRMMSQEEKQSDEWMSRNQSNESSEQSSVSHVNLKMPAEESPKENKSSGKLIPGASHMSLVDDNIRGALEDPTIDSHDFMLQWVPSSMPRPVDSKKSNNIDKK